MPLKNILAIVGALPLATAVGCPYINGNGNQARAVMPHPESILESRYSPEGPDFGQCPRKSAVAGGGTRSRQWWPCELNLAVLRQNSDKTNPFGGAFDYASAFSKLDGRFCSIWGNKHKCLFTTRANIG
jgi:catalase-peroxidase